MITENVSTLKINKMTQAQYERELAAGNIKDDEIYLTPIVEVGVQEVSWEFDVTPVGEAANYSEVESIEVYKHGNVISGTLFFRLNGGGEYDNYKFNFSSPYVPIGCVNPVVSVIPYTSVGFCDLGSVCAGIREQNELDIVVYNYGVIALDLSFTYICQ